MQNSLRGGGDGGAKDRCEMTAYVHVEGGQGKCMEQSREVWRGSGEFRSCLGAISNPYEQKACERELHERQ